MNTATIRGHGQRDALSNLCNTRRVYMMAYNNKTKTVTVLLGGGGGIEIKKQTKLTMNLGWGVSRHGTSKPFFLFFSIRGQLNTSHSQCQTVVRLAREQREEMIEHA